MIDDSVHAIDQAGSEEREPLLLHAGFSSDLGTLNELRWTKSHDLTLLVLC